MNSIDADDDESRFPANPNCEETHATLRFVGDELDPDEVTRALGIEPEEAHRRGDLREGKDGREYRYPRGVWFITTKGTLGTNLEQHLRQLLRRLEPVRPRLVSFAQSHGAVRFEILCYWMSATGHGGPSISPSTLAEIGALGATLDFDIYSAV